jgi:hypothetical protein
MGCSLAERLALILLELSETFGLPDSQDAINSTSAILRIWLNWWAPHYRG